ncbi:ATP-dependent RNA helicase dbp10 [Sorochytrium milnesiophthora]
MDARAVDGKDVFASDASDSDDNAFIAGAHLQAARKKSKSGGFQSMGLQHATLKAITHMGYKVPTPIQRKAVPLILEGKDVVGMARTGSGKTAAFLVPMIEKLKTHTPVVGVRAVVLSPSRELALQTTKFCKSLAKYSDLRITSLVGGDSMDDQFGAMAGNPDILIATPGRLLHLLVEMNLDLRLVEYVVFDEADRLFELGFSVQLHEIVHRMPPPENRQTVLFSATLPKVLVDFAKAGLKADPVLVRLDAETKISQDLEMAFFTMKPVEKEGALLFLLREIIKTPYKADVARTGNHKTGAHGQSTQTIIFVSTKHHVEYLNSLLSEQGYAVSYIYGALEQSNRNFQLQQFRNGQTHLLIVTDVAARGIDIPILENVVNWDFTSQSKVFVHRVGRVARAGRRGWAWSFVTSDELPYLLDLQLFLGRELAYTSSAETARKEYDYTRDMVVGAMPYHLMENDLELVKTRLVEDVNAQGQHRTAANGYKLYLKSRPAASTESYKRTKSLMQTSPFGQGIHPLLVRHLPAQDTERVDLLKQLAHFRPGETVFEVGKRGLKSAEAQLMKQRRATLGGTIAKAKDEQAKAIETERLRAAKHAEAGDGSLEMADETTLTSSFVVNTAAAARGSKTKRKRTEATGDSGSAKRTKRTTFVDPNYYMPYLPADYNTERGYSMKGTTSLAEGAQKAVLDLTGDDENVLRHKKGRLTWDARRKDFKRETVGADNRKLIKGESGVKLPASLKSDRFDQWRSKNKLRMPRVGEMELPHAAQMARDSAAKKWQNKSGTSNDDGNDADRETSEPLRRGKHPMARGGKKKPAPSSHSSRDNKKGGRGKPRSELRSVKEIAKQRKIKEKRKEKNARPSRKKGMRR